MDNGVRMLVTVVVEGQELVALWPGTDKAL